MGSVRWRLEQKLSHPAVLTQNSEHASRQRATCLLPVRLRDRRSRKLRFLEHAVDDLQDQICPALKVPIEHGRAGIEFTGEAPHRQGLRTLLVSDF